MSSIIHHWAMRNFLRFSLVFFAAIPFLVPAFAYAQGYDQAFAEGMLEITDVLEKEIVRDETSVSSNMTAGHLRQLREKLAADLGRKEKTLTAIKRVKYPAIESAIQAVEETFNAETQIVADFRVNDVVQTRVVRAIRDNLPKKKQALTDFKSWLKTNPY